MKTRADKDFAAILVERPGAAHIQRPFAAGLRPKGKYFGRQHVRDQIVMPTRNSEKSWPRR